MYMHVVSPLYANIACHLPLSFFFFNDTATTEIYTLSLHDALPISDDSGIECHAGQANSRAPTCVRGDREVDQRSEEHTSELQSPCNLVCRLLLEKKNKLTLKSLLSSPATSMIHILL